MKIKYVKPDSSPVQMLPWEMLLASGAIDASGQDYEDPIVIDPSEIF